jgi:hypothetical protein
LRGEPFFGKTNKILKSSLAGSTELTTGFLVLFQQWKKNKTILRNAILNCPTSNLLPKKIKKASTADEKLISGFNSFAHFRI